MFIMLYIICNQTWQLKPPAYESVTGIYWDKPIKMWWIDGFPTIDWGDWTIERINNMVIPGWVKKKRMYRNVLQFNISISRYTILKQSHMLVFGVWALYTWSLNMTFCRTKPEFGSLITFKLKLRDIQVKPFWNLENEWPKLMSRNKHVKLCAPGFIKEGGPAKALTL